MTASTETTTDKSIRVTAWELDLFTEAGRLSTRKIDGLDDGWLEVDRDGVRIRPLRHAEYGQAAEPELAEEFFPRDRVAAVRRYVRDVPAFTSLEGDLQPVPWCATHDHPAVTDADPMLGRDCEIGRREDSLVACRIVRARGSNAAVSSWAETAVGR